MRARISLVALMLVALSLRGDAQVTSDRLLRAADEPQNWITYSGGYAGQRHSLLTQITPGNVKNLELKWILPNQVFGAWQSSPIVVDGMMYVTQRPNDVLAVDAKTGRVFWQYRYTNSPDARVCCGANNRGVAHPGRHALHGDARRAPRRDRQDHRALSVGRAGRRSQARLLDHDGARSSSRTRCSSDRVAGSTAFAASSPRSTRRPVRKCGAFTPFPDLARKETRRGEVIPGRQVADPSG